mmetsp:Transcript_17398/g.42627  ORF Transcript_17398/g.42627 Transcript_17398/m.42627 type:complete len:204 (+) Transcript_17398:2491-3102(+)
MKQKRWNQNPQHRNQHSQSLKKEQRARPLVCQKINLRFQSSKTSQKAQQTSRFLGNHERRVLQRHPGFQSFKMEREILLLTTRSPRNLHIRHLTMVTQPHCLFLRALLKCWVEMTTVIARETLKLVPMKAVKGRVAVILHQYRYSTKHLPSLELRKARKATPQKSRPLPSQKNISSKFLLMRVPTTQKGHVVVADYNRSDGIP